MNVLHFRYFRRFPFFFVVPVVGRGPNVMKKMSGRTRGSMDATAGKVRRGFTTVTETIKPFRDAGIDIFFLIFLHLDEKLYADRHDNDRVRRIAVCVVLAGTRFDLGESLLVFAADLVIRLVKHARQTRPEQYY